MVELLRAHTATRQGRARTWRAPGATIAWSLPPRRRSAPRPAARSAARPRARARRRSAPCPAPRAHKSVGQRAAAAFGELEQRRGLPQRTRERDHRALGRRHLEQRDRRLRRSPSSPARSRDARAAEQAHRARLVGERRGIGLDPPEQSNRLAPSPLSSRAAERARLRFVGAVEQIEADRRVGLVDRAVDARLGGLHFAGRLRDA